MRKIGLFVLVFGVLALPFSAASADGFHLRCEFSRGVGLNAVTGKFAPDGEVRRFLFRMPSNLRSGAAVGSNPAPVRWTNLVGGWDGEATAILDGSMVTIIERALTDNGFITRIWLNKPDKSGAFEAIHVLAAHSSLPAHYSGSSLFVGRCK
jgi:hypothetical protein